LDKANEKAATKAGTSGGGGVNGIKEKVFLGIRKNIKMLIGLGLADVGDSVAGRKP